MTIPVVITGVTVLSVVITACTLALLGFCLWPVVQDIRSTKRLQEKQSGPDDLSNINNVNQERL